MSPTTIDSPDHRAFLAAIQHPSFVLGEIEGRWRLHDAAWPIAFIEIAAASGSFVLRFDLTGYPEHPPTAQPWDVTHNARLADGYWPRSKGGRVGMVFRTDWMSGSALYLPCDRVTINTHQGWRTEMPAQMWRADGTVVQYLEVVHELLNSFDFVPPLLQAA